MSINAAANWDKWESVFLVKSPIKYIYLSYRWPISQWIKLTGINKNSKIMEVGCGGGSMGLYFAARNFNVTFSDISECLLRDCKENVHRIKRFFPRIGSSLVCQDVFKIAFKDDSCDLIISDGFYEHFQEIEQRRKALVEMTRVVKNGGSILISIPNNLHPFLARWKAEGYDYCKEGYEYREIVLKAEDFKKELESFGLYNVIVDGWKVYESIYSSQNNFLLKMTGNLLRFFLPCVCRALRIKFGLSLYGLGKVKKDKR